MTVRSALVLSLAMSFSLAAVMMGNAKPQFAQKEKKSCGYCHLKPQGGGARGFRGLYYKAHGYSFKNFNEAREAKLAGVKPNALGPDSKPTKPYPKKAKSK